MSNEETRTGFTDIFRGDVMESWSRLLPFSDLMRNSSCAPAKGKTIRGHQRRGKLGEHFFFFYMKAHFVFGLFTKQSIYPIKGIQDVKEVRGDVLRSPSLETLQRLFFFFLLNRVPSDGDHQNSSALVSLW